MRLGLRGKGGGGGEIHSTRIKRFLEEHSKGLADRLTMRSKAERGAKMSRWHPCVDSRHFREMRIRPGLEVAFGHVELKVPLRPK